MVSDRKMFAGLLVLLLLPLTLAIFGGDRFRYPCQDPKNWNKEMCQYPQCDVTRTCPEHIFKGQRDPRLGPQSAKVDQPMAQTGQMCQACPPQGVNNAK